MGIKWIFPCDELGKKINKTPRSPRRLPILHVLLSRHKPQISRRNVTQAGRDWCGAKRLLPRRALKTFAHLRVSASPFLISTRLPCRLTCAATNRGPFHVPASKTNTQSAGAAQRRHLMPSWREKKYRGSDGPGALQKLTPVQRLGEAPKTKSSWWWRFCGLMGDDACQMQGSAMQW